MVNWDKIIQGTHIRSVTNPKVTGFFITKVPNESQIILKTEIFGNLIEDYSDDWEIIDEPKTNEVWIEWLGATIDWGIIPIGTLLLSRNKHQWGKLQEYDQQYDSVSVLLENGSTLHSSSDIWSLAPSEPDFSL